MLNEELAIMMTILESPALCTFYILYQDTTFNRGVIETIKAFQLPKSQIKGIDHFFYYLKLNICFH